MGRPKSDNKFIKKNGTTIEEFQQRKAVEVLEGVIKIMKGYEN